MRHEGWLRFILAIICCIVTTSCSIVHVHTNDEVKIYRKFGFVNIVEPEESGAAVSIEFFGTGYVDGSIVVGYQKSNSIQMAQDGCVVFLDEMSKLDSGVMLLFEKYDCNFIFQGGN